LMKCTPISAYDSFYLCMPKTGTYSLFHPIVVPYMIFLPA
jgi:hypothetical protein